MTPEEMRLSFSPEAIREHMDCEAVEHLPDDVLMRVADAALSDSRLYDVFHEVIIDALAEEGIEIDG